MNQAHTGPTLHAERALLAQGWCTDVRIGWQANGIIDRLEVNVPPLRGEERAAIIIPGLSNLHSHAFQRGMASLAERRSNDSDSDSARDSFWTWRVVMYHFLERLTPDDMRAIAAMAYIEMLESGFTRVGEFHYLHHASDGRAYDRPAAMAGAIAEAAHETGIALSLLPVFYAHGGFGGTAPSDAQRRFVTTLDSYAKLREDARDMLRGLPGAVLGIAPHSLRAVNREELAALVTMAESDAPFHIHIAEQTAEVDACLAWYGERPVSWLLANAPVDHRWCLVHATWMDEREVRALAASGAVAGLCPVTEANLGDGLFSLPTYIEAGGIWGVGSDSNVLIDAAEELRWLEYGQRLIHRSRNIMKGAAVSTGAALFDAALAGGARALGGTCQIALGASADLVSLDHKHPVFAHERDDAILDGWIFAGGRSAIADVWRSGRHVVQAGRHHHRETIVDQYKYMVHRLAT